MLDLWRYFTVWLKKFHALHIFFLTLGTAQIYIFTGGNCWFFVGYHLTNWHWIERMSTSEIGSEQEESTVCWNTIQKSKNSWKFPFGPGLRPIFIMCNFKNSNILAENYSENVKKKLRAGPKFWTYCRSPPNWKPVWKAWTKTPDWTP